MAYAASVTPATESAQSQLGRYEASQASGRLAALAAIAHPARTSTRLAARSSVRFALPTFGYSRSSESSASMMAAATTTRVNHLLSAGTTYQGASSVAVSRIASSYARM